LEDIDCGDDAMTLPTFVVIGAMKAGTVNLRHYLDEHPHVFIGRGEPNFFIAEDNWPRGRGWYESLFDGADRAAAIGECSPCYTWAHLYRGVPERMAQVVPEARLVYVVRDPIARMQSMYTHQVSAGRERRRAEVALLDDRYLGPSLYGFQLDLRHAHASWLLAGGADLQVVKQRLGHGSLRTTEKYLNTRVLHQPGEKPQVGRSARAVW
jgi:hypothetical protein